MAHLGPLLAPSWRHLGPSWPLLAPSWPCLGSILAPCWPILTASCPRLVHRGRSNSISRRLFQAPVAAAVVGSSKLVKQCYKPYANPNKVIRRMRIQSWSPPRARHQDGAHVGGPLKSRSFFKGQERLYCVGTSTPQTFPKQFLSPSF